MDRTSKEQAMERFSVKFVDLKNEARIILPSLMSQVARATKKARSSAG